MADIIGVTFAAVEQGSADTTAVSGQLGGTLQALEAYLRPLVSTWTGAASEAYEADRAKWQQGAEQCNDVLRRIGQALSTAHDNYTSAEQANVSRFAG